MGVAASVKLDDRSAEAQRSFDLPLGWLDEQADPNTSASELIDEISKMIVLAGSIETTFGRPLLSPLGNDASSMGPMAQRDLQHLLGRRHLQIERQVDLGHQPVDVVVGDVPAVFAQMGGDSVSARLAAMLAARTGSG